MDSSKAAKKLTVLCLHGFFNNTNVVNHQLRHYRQLFGKYVRFVPINAPFECENVFDQAIARMFKAPFYSWYFYDPSTCECRGIEESVEYVVDYINNHGPFDGVLGFSQGTMMARILLKMNEFKSTFPKLEVDPPKFGVIFSGMFTERARYFPQYDEDCLKVLTEFQQPMLYVYGDKDPLKQNIEGALVKEGDYTIIKHDYAHNIPKLKYDDLEEFTRFFDRMYYNINGENMELDFSDFDI
ncbi:unnamed protein product [Moneuplotes crassus]|uniref:Serine hydrolase domain-containing protein n=1 Tax=Euplotes crassus TaxID=5936 RepID=A0AAD1XW65_EUPCR|nr:unnamed protein product [Moneuplotes crassus]